MTIKASEANVAPCLFIVVLTFFSWHLDAKTCGEKTEVDPCPEGWELTPGPHTCLRSLTLHLNWTAASEACREHGAELAVITNEETNAFLSSYIRKRFGTFWLSIKRKVLPGQKLNWKWDYGEPNKATKDLPKWAVHTMWKKGHPDRNFTTNQDKDCVVFMYKAGWKDVFCNSTHPIICEIILAKNEHNCPDNWIYLGYSHDCLVTTDVQADWQGAVDYCSKFGAHPLTMLKKNKKDILDYYLGSEFQAWIGLSDPNANGKWQWPTGMELGDKDYMNLKKKKGEVDEYEHCILVHEGGDWQDFDCEQRIGGICQIEARNESRNTQAHVEYHRPDQIVFLNQPFTVVCTSDDTDPESISWSIHDDLGNFHKPLDAVVARSVELVEEEDGRCVSRGFLRYTVPGHPYFEGLRFSCFNTLQSADKTCLRVSDSLRTCATSESITILDGPKSPPNLTMFYKGKPALDEPKPTYRLMDEDASIIAQCEASIGEAGLLTWVMYLKSGAEVVPRSSGMVKEYETFLDPATKSNSSKSVLQFKMQRRLNGFYVACFSYDVAKYSKDLSCSDSNTYCDKSAKLTVIIKQPPGPGHWLTYPRLGFFILLCLMVTTLVALYKPIKALGENDGRSDFKPVSLPRFSKQSDINKHSRLSKQSETSKQSRLSKESRLSKISLKSERDGY